VPLGAGESVECKHLRPADVASSEEIIELQTPRAGEKIVLKKTGVIVEFSREEFRRSAECLGYTESVHWVDTETGGTPESPLRDAFQLSYVAAALLDVGRASVRLQEETDWRTSIVRGPWSAVGCAGQCRSSGRIYRLTPGASSFFLRVSDAQTSEVD
jgi:hypothetical protein